MRRYGFVLGPVLLAGALAVPAYSSASPAPTPLPSVTSALASLHISGPTFVNYGPRGGVRATPTATNPSTAYARTATRSSTTPTSDFANDTATKCTTGLPVNVCVHYQSGTPSPATPNAAVPAFVTSIVDEFQRAEAKYVGSGYRPVEADPATAKVMNVFLEDLNTWDEGSFRGAFGFTALASNSGINGPSGWSTAGNCASRCDRAAFMVLDNDFACSQYGDACANPYDSTQIMQVTVSHEFFHATQFTYNAYGDPWFMEGTATWAETQVEPTITDNRTSYLFVPGVGALGAPNAPLDDNTGGTNPSDPNASGLALYQNFVFFQFLGEHYPSLTGSMPTVVLNGWRYSDTASGLSSYTGITAIAHELARQGSSLATAWRNFVLANRAPTQNYRQGAHYPGARLAWAKTVSGANLSPITVTRYVPHLASQTMQLVPSNVASNVGVQLVFRVSNPRAGLVGVQVKFRNGSIRVYRVDTSSGTAHVNLGFSSAAVSSIEIGLANAGATYYGCGSQAVGYNCHGLPSTGNVGFTWTASFYRS
jgi:hypothetical protein